MSGDTWNRMGCVHSLWFMDVVGCGDTESLSISLPLSLGSDTVRAIMQPCEHDEKSSGRAALWGQPHSTATAPP